MRSSDVLDEITGSIGITGAVDGTLILKRDRGQQEATLFVTGRDVEQEQHLALSFDPMTALWTLIGIAEEVCRSKERKAIFDLLTGQLPEGMCPREIARTLEKNYHTTRTLLRKMEEAGDITCTGKKYLACSQQTSEYVPLPPSCSGAHHEIDYVDDSDDDNDTQREQVSAGRTTSSTSYSSFTASDMAPRTNETARTVEQRENRPTEQHRQAGPCNPFHTKGESESTISVCRQSLHCNQRNHCVEPASLEEVPATAATSGNHTSSLQDHAVSSCEKHQCPHHPHQRRVRFDPAGQAWCDQPGCWDCYRLMKIGEALHYPPLVDRGGKRLIEQGQEAWSRFVCTQRAFPIVVATEEAIIVCHKRGIAVPDLSGEVVRLQSVSPGS